MPVRFRQFVLLMGLVGGGALGLATWGQEPLRQRFTETVPTGLLAVPRGVEVLARGPVHEAFATPLTDPAPTRPVGKAPPRPLAELPPDEKPAGDLVWMGGYWAWDEERNDYLWISGIWRAPPPGQRWVAGYWRTEGLQWHWVPGFWTEASRSENLTQPLTYLPEPPARPAAPFVGRPPTPDSFYVPGHWAWQDGTTLSQSKVYGVRGTAYVWKEGYWARLQPGHVWVPAHYRWTPSGVVFSAGYWDWGVAERGVLFAPVVTNLPAAGPRFIHTPVYVVSEQVLIEALFTRPGDPHYYYGDYYGPRARQMGFKNCLVSSQRHEEPFLAFERARHRGDPHWEAALLDRYWARTAGQASRPPQTLGQQERQVEASPERVLVPVAQWAAAKGVPMVPLDRTARAELEAEAQAVQQLGQQRQQLEGKVSPGTFFHPRTNMLQVLAGPPALQPTAVSGMAAREAGRQTILAHPEFTPIGFGAMRPMPLSAPEKGFALTPPQSVSLPAPPAAPPALPAQPIPVASAPSVVPLASPRTASPESKPTPSSPVPSPFSPPTTRTDNRPTGDAP